MHHGPHYTMPERAAVPKVVTIHDLTFLDHPEWHERSKVVVFRRAIRVAARRADAIICVSEHTAQRLGELCAPTGRVFVIPHGVDHDRFRPEATLPAARSGTGADRSGTGPDRRPIMSTSSASASGPRTSCSWGRSSRARRCPISWPPSTGWPAPTATGRVAGAGRPTGLGGRAVRPGIGAASAADRIVRTGYVPDDAVPALLRQAAVAAYPALEEGFGLPALEALACGAPLVTTAGTAMAEVAAGAASPGHAGIGARAGRRPRRRAGRRPRGRGTPPSRVRRGRPCTHLGGERGAAYCGLPVGGRRRRADATGPPGGCPGKVRRCVPW